MNMTEQQVEEIIAERLEMFQTADPRLFDGTVGQRDYQLEWLGFAESDWKFLANPPFGGDWSKFSQSHIEEAKQYKRANMTMCVSFVQLTAMSSVERTRIGRLHGISLAMLQFIMSNIPANST